MSYRVTVLMQEIVGGVIRRYDHVAKLKISLGMFVGESGTFMLAKIHTAIASICPLSVCRSVHHYSICPFIIVHYF